MDNFDFETSDIVAEATKKYSPEKGKKKQDQFDMKKKDNQYGLFSIFRSKRLKHRSKLKVERNN